MITQTPFFSLRQTVWALIPMVIAFALAMDVYVPAVPKMSTIFHASAGEMQLTLSLFMLTAGIVQLLLGPLSDDFGRRPITILSIILFSIGTILCALADSTLQIIFFRIIQSCGATGMMVVGFAMVRDRHHGEASGKAYSYLNGAIAFSPMFAPFIGSYLDVYYGWPFTFWVLLIISAWALLNLFFLPETLAKENRLPLNTKIFVEYYQIFLNPIFAGYTFATMAGLTYLFVFCSISPYVIIRLLHIPEIHYGYYFAFMGVSLFLGSFLASYLVGRLGIYKTVLLGFFISLAGGIVMLTWYQITGLTINNFIWPMLLIGIGGTLGLGAGSGGAMEPFGRSAGAAAALGGSIRFLFSALVGMVGISKNVQSTLPLCVPAVIFSLIGIVWFIKYQAVLKQMKADTT